MNAEQQHRKMVMAFGGDLKDEYIGAGKPSYRKISDTISYSPATISRAFAGKTLPQWPFVDAFLRYCGRSEEEIVQWRGRWATIMKVASLGDAEINPDIFAPPAVDPDDVAPTGKHAKQTGSRECQRCGVAVLNTEVHQQWHDEAPRLTQIHAV